VCSKFGISKPGCSKKNLRGFKNFFEGVQIFFRGFKYLNKKLFKKKKPIIYFIYIYIFQVRGFK
jgi:hypothetical protein